MTHLRVVDVHHDTAFGPYCFHIDWSDGTATIVDLCAPIHSLSALAPLQDSYLLAHVRVDDWGMGIRWDERMELSVETLAALAKKTVMTDLVPA